MPVQYDEVLDAATARSEEDRARLVDALIGTLSPAEAADFDEAWTAVLDRRSREIDEGKVTLVPWADVKGRAVVFRPDA